MPRHTSSRFFRRATAPLRSLPDFVIPGAQKSGTTFLYSCLGKHPGVITASKKEVNFFNSDKNWNRGPNWYRAHFPTRSALASRADRIGYRALTGESTPRYMFVADGARRMSSLVPQAKIIVLIRDPVERAFSQYQMRRRRGTEHRAWETVIARELRTLRAIDFTVEDHVADLKSAQYLGRGMYVYQLLRLQSHFPLDQILIVRAEDMFEEPQSAYSRVLAFLGLPDTALNAHVTRRQTTFDSVRSPNKDEICEFLRPHTARLYDVLQRDMSWPSMR